MRERLPSRRNNETGTIHTESGLAITATVGFFEGRPAEIFLSGAKAGTDFALILDDASVVISIALQHGIRAREMRYSVSPDGASVIGAALDFIVSYEGDEPERPRPPALPGP